MFPHQFQAGHSPREQKTFIFSLKFQAMLSVAFELRKGRCFVADTMSRESY